MSAASKTVDDVVVRSLMAGNSGGVGVLVPKFVGIDQPILPGGEKGWSVASGRAVAAIAHSIVPYGILLVSIYLVTGQPITSSENWGILMKVACVLQELQLPFILGGDWQNTPDSLRASRFF